MSALNTYQSETVSSFCIPKRTILLKCPHSTLHQREEVSSTIPNDMRPILSPSHHIVISIMKYLSLFPKLQLNEQKFQWLSVHENFTFLTFLSIKNYWLYRKRKVNNSLNLWTISEIVVIYMYSYSWIRNISIFEIFFFRNKYGQTFSSKLIKWQIMLAGWYTG